MIHSKPQAFEQEFSPKSYTSTAANANGAGVGVSSHGNGPLEQSSANGYHMRGDTSSFLISPNSAEMTGHFNPNGSAGEIMQQLKSNQFYLNNEGEAGNHISNGPND